MTTSRSENLIVPPFVCGDGRCRAIGLSHELMAARAAETVRTAWKDVGHQVRVWVEQQTLPGRGKSPHGCVRSELISGLPRHVWIERYRQYLAAGGRPVKVKQEWHADVV